MGHNVDLKNLLGLPDYVRCPKCKEKTKTWFDEYDIDCGDPTTNSSGYLDLDVQCDHCEEDFEFRIKIHYDKEE